VPHHSRADIVIARWREIERELEGVAAGTGVAKALRAEANSLRDEYQRLLERAQRADRREPPAQRE
jgi:hypothetical protein